MPSADDNKYSDSPNAGSRVLTRALAQSAESLSAEAAHRWFRGSLPTGVRGDEVGNREDDDDDR